jgi:hypothetical protein
MIEEELLSRCFVVVRGRKKKDTTGKLLVDGVVLYSTTIYPHNFLSFFISSRVLKTFLYFMKRGMHRLDRRYIYRVRETREIVHNL